MREVLQRKEQTGRRLHELSWCCDYFNIPMVREIIFNLSHLVTVQLSYFMMLFYVATYSTFKITSHINCTWLYLTVSEHSGSITDSFPSWHWHLCSAYKVHCLLIYPLIWSLPLWSQQSLNPCEGHPLDDLPRSQPVLAWPSACLEALNLLSLLGSG